jgi:hypothetical protein
VDEPGSELADDLDLDPRLLQDGGGRVLTLRHAQLPVLLEDEQLVRAGQRMLAGHVDEDACHGHGSASSFAIRSAIAAVVRFVFARGMVGMIDASATNRFSKPKTRPSGSTTSPIAHVPVG